MATLRSPSGGVIQASGRLADRLLAQGWTETADPPAPGLRLVTAEDLDATSAAVDAVQAWRAQAVTQIATILSTVQAIDVPAAVQAYLTAHPAPAGQPGTPGVDGKSAYQLARDGGYGGTQTQWLASLVGAQGVKGDQGNPGAPGTTDYNALTNRPTLATVAASGSYADLTNKPTLGTAATKDTGTGAAQVVLGNDARLTDARTASNVRQAVVSSAALTANTVKTVNVTWTSALPNATYAVSVTVEHASAPQQFNCSVVSRTTTGCVVAVRSTAAVSAPGVNLHVLAIA